MTLDQQHHLAQIWYEDRFDEDGRRRPTADSQAILASVGLTGAFWQLA